MASSSLLAENGARVTIFDIAAKHRKPRQSGRIIVTTSMAAFDIEAGIGAAYMAAKAGAAHLMRNAAPELAKYNIWSRRSRPAVHHQYRRRLDEGESGAGRVASTEEMKGLACSWPRPAHRPGRFMAAIPIRRDNSGSWS
jgi:NAD(P)-dependent dehydrogenase (short-subunit alcohol dehydrogenase family)